MVDRSAIERCRRMHRVHPAFQGSAEWEGAAWVSHPRLVNRLLGF
jgi:hypothetical protein